jgi:hypothetical protein
MLDMRSREKEEPKWFFFFFLVARVRPARAKFPLYHLPQNLSSKKCKKIAQISFLKFVQLYY